MPNEHINKLFKVVFVFVIIISVYFVVLILSNLKSYKVAGNKDVYTVVLSGHGEVTAVPDIANVSFTISKDAKTVKEAQSAVAKVEKASLDFLKSNNIADKDIKTINASFYPKYEYQYDNQIMMPCQYNCPPRPGKNMITGYTASESITVKIRNIDDAGKIMQGLGTVGVSDLNGPNFAIDNEDGLKVEARKKAIDEAKTKAEVLAKDLGVRLGRITSFSESSNYYPMPMYAKSEMLSVGAKDVASAVIPKGENTISSDVTITYEIK